MPLACNGGRRFILFRGYFALIFGFLQISNQSPLGTFHGAQPGPALCRGCEEGWKGEGPGGLGESSVWEEAELFITVPSSYSLEVRAGPGATGGCGVLQRGDSWVSS